jgi:eukaryotic-like serine/threonine-protein kinase
VATKLPRQLQSALNRYSVLDQIGQGGAGVVQKVRDETGAMFAAKILNPDLATTDRRKRFENELQFCLRNQHSNIVQVTDFGLTTVKSVDTPFLVMPLYDETLRKLMTKGIAPNHVLPLFAKILDGVEAAHLRGIAHRDLKPENILLRSSDDALVIADFGIAQFTQEELYAAVETHPNARLANFVYAAPEQRTRGTSIDLRADIYALGLILNELFTKQVLQGTDFDKIAGIAPDFQYLDEVVHKMVSQKPANRFSSIDEIKKELIARRQLFVSRQKLDAVSREVVPETTIDHPLVREPIAINSVDYEPGELLVTLNKGPSADWVALFHQVSGVTFFAGQGPATVSFRDAVAIVPTSEHNAPMQLAHFRGWVQKANAEFKDLISRQHEGRIQAERKALAEKVAREAERQRVLKKLSS